MCVNNLPRLLHESGMSKGEINSNAKPETVEPDPSQRRRRSHSQGL